MLAVVLLVLLECWKLVAAELLSSGNATPSALFPTVETASASSLRCSDWLLGQVGKVPSCSTSDIGFLLVGCDGGTAAAAEGTASGTAVDADGDSGAGAGIPEGDSA
jgi:hypothetical protein